MKRLLDVENLIEDLDKRAISNDTPFSYDSLTTIEDTKSLIDSVEKRKENELENATVYILLFKNFNGINYIDSVYSSKEKAWERIEKIFNFDINCVKDDENVFVSTTFSKDSFIFFYGDSPYNLECKKYTILEFKVNKWPAEDII